MVAAIESRTLLRQRYLVQQLLGQGGFGRTYLALDHERFDEPCVLKEFTVSYQDEALVEKAKVLFAREASILHQVQHPQIPRFWAAFEWEDRLFLVQDYIQGENYRTLLQYRRDRGETLSEVEVLHLLNHLLPVLAYLHDRQIVHRDISPENLVLSPAKGHTESWATSHDYTAGLPILLDFGSVKAATSGLSLAPSMTRIGKVGYAPPEQLQTGNVHPHSDLYALAATCIVLLTGREPHQLLDSLTLDWHWQSYAPVSREFANILNRMLALHPNDRYQSATAVHSDLQRLLGVLTPMIWRPEYVSWQGFTSPIHPSATTGPYSPNGKESKTELPPTRLQKLGRKFNCNWQRAANVKADSVGNVATLPPIVEPVSGTIEEHQGIRFSPNQSTVWSRFDWRRRLSDWSMGKIMIASGTIIAGIGIYVFRAPLPGIEQIWPTSGPTSAAIQSPYPTVIATEPNIIEFAPGEVSAFVQGNLQENQTRIYQFRADKDQIMGVTLEGSGVKMNLLRADQSPVDYSSRQTRSWAGQLPGSERYQIQITGSGAYTLDMAISPNQKAQPPNDQPISFDQGFVKTVTGEILADQKRRYFLQAQKGQQIGFKVLQGDLRLKVLAPSGNPLGSSATAWQGKTPISGKYTIEVTSQKREDYALSFELK